MNANKLITFVIFIYNIITIIVKLFKKWKHLWEHNISMLTQNSLNSFASVKELHRRQCGGLVE